MLQIKEIFTEYCNLTFDELELIKDNTDISIFKRCIARNLILDFERGKVSHWVLDRTHGKPMQASEVKVMKKDDVDELSDSSLNEIIQGTLGLLAPDVKP